MQSRQQYDAMVERLFGKGAYTFNNEGRSYLASPKPNGAVKVAKVASFKDFRWQ